MTCGIDLIEIARIEKSMQNPRFIDRYFSIEEQLLFESRKWKASVVAGNFAAKEAFSKSLGTGIRGFQLHEISVLRNELGAPYLILTGKAKEIAGERQFSVSISNTKELANAIVIAF